MNLMRTRLSPGCQPEPHAAAASEVLGAPWHRGGQATKQRERIEVDRDRAVGKGALEGDAYQALGALGHTLLGDGRAEHVLEERLARPGVEPAGSRGGMEREAVNTCAERLVELQRLAPLFRAVP